MSRNAAHALAAQAPRWAALALAVLAGGPTACVEESPATRAADATTDATADALPDGTTAPDARPTADQGPDAALPDAAPPPACAEEDDLSPNHRPAAATAVSVGFSRADLYLCAGQPDHFAFPLAEGESVTLTLAADPPERDLDLAVLDADGAVVARSAGERGDERLSFTAPTTGTWQVQVEGYRGTAAGYALSISGGCTRDAQCPADQVCRRSQATCVPYEPGLCGADRNEPNDRDDTATPIAVGIALNGLICDEDRDWFTFTVEAGATIEAAVFNPAGADLDLVAVDVDRGGILALAQNEASQNPEIVRLTALPAGTYAVGVFSFASSERDVAYTFEIAGRSQPCVIDRDCANDPFPRCDAGVCGGVDGGGLVGLGRRCAALSDCTADATRCHVGGAGGHDNVCTISCNNDAGCAALGPAAYCNPVDQNLSVCLPACVDDDDCSRFRTCGGRARCDLRGECEADRDCGAGEICDVLPFGRFCLLSPLPVACGADTVPYTDNDLAAGAPALPLDGTVVAGLNLCNADRDHFTLEVPAEAAGQRLDLSVGWPAGPDLDFYLYDAEGRLVAQASAADRNPEVATAAYLPAGRYVLLVDQYSAPRLVDTPYTVQATLSTDAPGCAEVEAACATLEPPRPTCDADTGACVR